MSHAGWGITRFKRINDCHPERKHYAKGLCRQCWRNTPEFLAKRQAYYQANPEQWRLANERKKQRRQRQVKAYGISREQLDALDAAQGHVCAICRSASGRRRLHVDHDHQTKRVRALLCGRCNSGLGQFRDSAELLLKAAEYLRARHHSVLAQAGPAINP